MFLGKNKKYKSYFIKCRGKPISPQCFNVLTPNVKTEQEPVVVQNTKVAEEKIILGVISTRSIQASKLKKK